MKKKFLYGTILLTMFLVLFFIFTPKAFAETGWRQVDGKWMYYWDEYSYVTGRYQIDGEWYLFDEHGVMQTGWYDDVDTWYHDGKKIVEHNWYYFGSDGKAYIGSKAVNGTWYYFDTYSGRMYTNRTANINEKVYLYGNSGAWIKGSGWKSISNESYTSWYYLEKDACVTGWKQVGKTWYYFSPYSGRMADGPIAIPFNGNEEDYRVYCFAKNGAWIQKPGAWYKVTETYEKATYTYWYYFNNTSYAVTGWKQIGGTWYYFAEDGIMVNRPTRIFEEDNETSEVYCFNNSGAWVKNPNGWYSYNDTWSDGTKVTTWYYFENGVAAEGFKTIGGKTYYFNKYDGSMATGTQSVETETGWDSYYFSEDGEMKTNYWYKYESKYQDSNGKWHTYVDWNHFGADGKKDRPTGWQKLEGAYYYFDEDGYMVSNTSEEIDGAVYFFDETGKMRSGGWVSKVENWYINGKSTEVTIWYYLAGSGEAAVGWKQIKGTWYCFDEWGRMLADTTTEVSAENWAEPAPDWEENEEWDAHYAKIAIYGFSKSGAMLKNTWYDVKWSWTDYETGEENSGTDWYYFGASGAATKGWKQVGKNWYYFSLDGRMVANETRQISSETYAFDKTGAMVSNNWYEDKWSSTDYETGEVHSGSDWYYMLASGKAARDQWVSSKGAWYFMDDNGRMLTNQTLMRSAKDWQKPVESWNSEEMSYEDWVKTYDIYVFDGNGVMVSNKWYKMVNKYTDSETGEEVTDSHWYYLDSKGHAYRGLQKVGSKYYFFDENYGEMRTNFSWFDDTTHRNYVFGDDGEQLFDSWYEDHYWTCIDGEEVEAVRMMYVGADGDFIRGWKVIGEDRYYFDEWNHEMYTGIHEIDGVTYEFLDDGKLKGEVNTETEASIGPGAGDMMDPTLGASVPEMEVIPVEEAEETEEVEPAEVESVEE